MQRTDVVAYLKENVKKFPVEDLRLQLTQEGVSAAEFDASLKEALRPAPTQLKAKASGAVGRVLMFSGVGAIIGAAALALLQKPSSLPAKTSSSTAAPAGPVDAAFVGSSGYVIKLPPGYAGFQSFKDNKKAVEIVHFCKADTDPTQFLNEGLFGQLGIVRLQVEPSPLANDLHGLDNLTSFVTSRAQARGEKYTIKNIQVSSLRGIQLTYDIPSPRVEAYILGQAVFYTFMAGQDDEIYRCLLQSLRDTRSET